MPQVCKVCSHPKKLEIERGLVRGRTKSSLSREFNVSESSLAYHAEHHLSYQLLQAYEKKAALESLDLLSEIEKLVYTTKRILKRAESKENDYLALSAIREARGTYDLLAKIAFSLHQARLAELELEQERKEQEAWDNGQSLEVLTNAELDVLGKLSEKLEKQDASIIVIPDPEPDLVSIPEQDPAPEPAPRTFKRSK